MNTTHKRRIRKEPLNETVIRQATSDVIAGKGLRWTADYYGINHTTLFYRVQAERRRREFWDDIIGETVAFN